MTSIFIFRRDLREQDNTALNEAYVYSKKYDLKLMKIFIFTPEQIEENKYRSDAAISFMIDSLHELSDVSYYHGTNEKILKELIQKFDVKAIFFNKDHTHYARTRDEQVKKLCGAKIHLHMPNDYNLHALDAINTQDGKFYEVFTPFYRKAQSMRNDIKKPITRKACVVYKSMSRYVPENIKNFTKGGRREGLRLLRSINNNAYKKARDNAYQYTTRLSAHIKFGTISIREAYFKFKTVNEILVKQLYWNEFYDQLMYNLDYDRTLGKSNYKNVQIKWKNNDEWFERWKNGTTGFPFIDAGMRQLKVEGWMHNRARMATANFLRLLQIDWRKGEHYFATMLVDYDVSQNNGNWQWSVGVGVDRTGFLRIYNPFRQSIKHDPKCEYIKKYIPELANVPKAHIHEWHKHHVKYDTYHRPLADYSMLRKSL
jgi:deoxyribodipyrimidine photo-lyase